MSRLQPIGEFSLHYRRFSLNLVVDAASLFTLIALALALRLHTITAPLVWYDEAYSLLLSEHTPREIWSLTARDVHPPLYYVLLHYWMNLFGNELFSSRLLSAVADAGTLLISVKLMARVATRSATWKAALLLALLPISVRYSQEARMYTLLGFWLMGATLAMVIWIKAPRPVWSPILYVLLMSAALYTSYFTALCILTHWLYWLSTRPLRPDAAIPVSKWVGVNIAIFVLYLPWLSYFVPQMISVAALGWIPPVTWQTLATIVWRFTVVEGKDDVSLVWRVIPTLIYIGCAATVLSTDLSQRRFSLLLVGYFVVPVLTILLASLIVPVFISRYLLFATAGVPIITAMALDVWGQRRPAVAFGLLGFFVIAQFTGLLKVYTQTDDLNGTAIRKEARIDVIAAGIKAGLLAGDKIIVDGLFWYLPFAYYNKTGIQPNLFSFDSTPDYSLDTFDYGGLALIPNGAKRLFPEGLMTFATPSTRVWWIGETNQTEHYTVFPKNWQQTQKIEGGMIQARLFILGATPTSP